MSFEEDFGYAISATEGFETESRKFKNLIHEEKTKFFNRLRKFVKLNSGRIDYLAEGPYNDSLIGTTYIIPLNKRYKILITAAPSYESEHNYYVGIVITNNRNEYLPSVGKQVNIMARQKLQEFYNFGFGQRKLDEWMQ